MICFKKERGRRRIINWKWKGEQIEEITEFKYLGYVLKKNEEDEGQIKKLKKKMNMMR